MVFYTLNSLHVLPLLSACITLPDLSSLAVAIPVPEPLGFLDKMSITLPDLTNEDMIITMTTNKHTARIVEHFKAGPRLLQ